MNSPFYFIVRPLASKRYDNTKNISSVDFIISTSEEDHKFSNRFAEVIKLPLKYNGPIKEGALLLVHHNVFKFYKDMKGNRRSGKSFFKDDLFFIDYDQFFMYKNNSKWVAYDRYCFVKPMPVIEGYIKKPFANEPLMGYMMYPNIYLREQGISEGDIVCFKPDSEYEFILDEEKLYRVYDHQITIKL